MKTKNSKGYRDHFGNAVSEFERELRKNKHLAKGRKQAVTVEDQIKQSNRLLAEDIENKEIRKVTESEDSRLAARNAMNFTAEACARKNAEKGFKYITNEKGNAERVEIEIEK
jgi:hypothetical protein